MSPHAAPTPADVRVPDTPAARRWWRAVSGPRGRDVVIIALSAIYTIVAAVVLIVTGHAAAGLLEFGISGLGTAALYWRRRHPLIVTAVGIPVTILTGNIIPICLGLMRIAIGRRDRLLVLATIVVGLSLAVPTVGTSDRFGLSELLAGMLGALFFTMWGAYVGARRDLISSLEDRAERAEKERELKAIQARLAERSRIASEMHDVLAHKVSLIALQAGGLEVNADAGPELVEQTAALIRSTARQALEDLRGVLGVLRSDQSNDGSELAPQPGIADLDQLVESSRAAGVRVTLTVSIAPDLPPQLGRTVYRIVQESLTNVHKHARGAATTVTARQSGGAVRVTVTNLRPISADSLLPGSGSGLIGLRERVVVVGGTAHFGPTPDGGWSVTAVLPVARDQDPAGAQELTGAENT